MTDTNILWFRQDLRLHDHAALIAAAAHGARVLPLYVLDDTDTTPWAVGAAARWWLHFSLAALAASLEHAGARLVLRRGNPATIVPELAETLGAAQVHAGRAHEPSWRAADASVAKALQSAGRSLVLHRTKTLIDPDQVKSQTGTVYGMYTPFARAVEALGEPAHPQPAPRKLNGATAPSDKLESWDLLPTKPDWAAGFRQTWTPGEAGAAQRLGHFTKTSLGSYATGRNLPGEDGTSMLSPHLHWGELSPSQAWHESRAGLDDADHHTWRRELIWRDFAAYLLWHHPTLPDRPLRPAFERLAFRTDKPGLRAWQRGQTGVPIVDAGMRQLWNIGWMHNRVRMITASFLVKHQLIAWQDGEAWFWDALVDGDLASNGVNWQWVAGTGIDSQPFFRVFNPLTQGQKFDPDGAYVRRWVPEIAALPDRYVHAPWLAPADALQAAGIRLGHDYPKPIVDLAEGRTRALAVYKRTVRESAA